MNDTNPALFNKAQIAEITTSYEGSPEGFGHVPEEMHKELVRLMKDAKKGDEEAAAKASGLLSGVFLDSNDGSASNSSINASLRLIGSNIFVYRGELCQVNVRKPEPDQTKLRDQEDCVSAEPLTPRAFARIINTTRQTFVKRGGRWERRAFSENAAKDYLALKGQWRVLQLTAIISAPTIDRDGEPIEKEGFHKDTGLYLHFRGARFKPIKEATEEDIHLFHSIFKECKFASEVDKAVAYAWVLTSLITYSLSTKPFFLITAPEMGSGKSALIDVGHILATGKRAEGLPLPFEDKEMHNTVMSKLNAGEQFICFDNVRGASYIESNVLCIATTQPFLSGRMMHTNRVKKFPCDALIAATGNGISIKGEMSARSLVCKLAHKDSKATQAKWEREPLEAQCIKRRAEFFSAAINILYSAKALPPLHFELKFPRFEDWNDWVRTAVMELLEVDPVKCVEAIALEDPEEVRGTALWELWHEATRGQAMSIKEAVRLGKDDNLKSYLSEEWPSRDILCSYDARRAGNWIAGKAGRVFGALRLDKVGVDHRTATYQTVFISKNLTKK